MKQYIGFVRDHSASMEHIVAGAMNDYNQNTQTIEKEAIVANIDTIVNVVECGGPRNGDVIRAAVNSSIAAIKPLYAYRADGFNTPLFQSVNEVIELMNSVPDRDDDGVSFLVMVITDGENNAGNVTGPQLSARLRTLQREGNWTFAFRVPRGYARALVTLGIPAGNIQEWEQTERGIRESSVKTQRAVSSYFAGRVKGVRSTERFYSDLSDVSKRDVKATMTNISSEVRIFSVKQDGRIDEFVEGQTKKPYVLGSGFYQLMKPERAVQDYKLIVIRDKKKGDVYAGQSARDLLGLPTTGSIKLAPGDHSHYDIFIQSTSANRKLIGGTYLLFWPHAAQAKVA